MHYSLKISTKEIFKKNISVDLIEKRPDLKIRSFCVYE